MKKKNLRMFYSLDIGEKVLIFNNTFFIIVFVDNILLVVLPFFIEEKPLEF